jgi:AdoMet-dependent heme synthase
LRERPNANPLELNTEQSQRFLRQLVDFGNPLPHLILTGGDPLSREDIYDLIDYANGLGLEVSITPSATPELTNDAITKLKSHGIQSLGLSLDGSCAEKHDNIRAVPGTFAHTMKAARHCGRLGLPIQVNTLVAEETVDDLPAIYELLRTSFPVMRWSLFFLISVGRGKALNEVSPEKGESIMRWVFDLSPHSPFAIKTTEAPSYRRIAIETMRGNRMAVPEMKETSVYKGFQIRDGHGIVFVSNLGKSILQDFCRCAAATSVPTPWSKSTATPRCSARCTRPTSSAENVAPASTAISAEDRERGPLPIPATRSGRTRFAHMNQPAQNSRVLEWIKNVKRAADSALYE